MKLRKTVITATGLALLVPLAGSVFASDDDVVRYGRDLMTPQEFADHRATMMKLSPEEREAYRAAHHEVMKERAAAQGVTLPDEPLARGHGRRFADTYGRPCPRGGYGRLGPRWIDD